jgi:hypothetical protein
MSNLYLLLKNIRKNLSKSCIFKDLEISSSNFPNITFVSVKKMEVLVKICIKNITKKIIYPNSSYESDH